MAVKKKVVKKKPAAKKKSSTPQKEVKGSNKQAGTGSPFVRAAAPPNGSRTRQVEMLMEIIAEAEGDPVKFEDACEEAGVKYPADIQPAMTALEIAGSIVRYTYVEKGSTKKKHAYAYNTEDDADRPTSAA